MRNKEISHLLRRIQVVGIQIEDRLEMVDIVDPKTSSHIVSCLQTALSEIRKARDPLPEAMDRSTLQ